MTIRIIKSCHEKIRETLDELQSTREAAVAYDEWKRDPVVARPWDEVDVELGADDKPDGNHLLIRK